MSNQDEWDAILDGHPIFDISKSLAAGSFNSEVALELSTNSFKSPFGEDSCGAADPLSGRRQVMTLKDADLIVAVGTELRIASLGDIGLGKGTRSYKVLHTPNVQFEIKQINLNPSGKILAIAGTYQVAVIILPRPGYSKLVPAFIDCKALHVGQFYHGSKTSAPVVKIEWHPWGEAGSTLMVMTADGKLREYDVSVDTEEPQQTVSFLTEKKSNSFMARDPAEREVTSFTLGQGSADWGPLTVYVVTRSGDIYAVCPYMPKNASVPSSYVHALECFISAKQEFISQGESTEASALSTMYDYQRKYVSNLIKQLPPGTVFPAVSRPVPMHPPHTIKSQPLRQGPFLLKPSPRIIDGSDGGDATDITYLAYISNDDDENGNQTERLGIVMVSYQDGKVDVCLDVEKVEARWESKQEAHQELPTLVVYESIDLGLVSKLKEPSAVLLENPLLELLQANHPILLRDPIHDDTVYVYHAFGVHALEFRELLQCLAAALRINNEEEDSNNEEESMHPAVEKPAYTQVTAMLDTFSIQRKCSNPVIGVCIPNAVFLSYSIIILTSVFRVTCFLLNLRTDPSQLQDTQELQDTQDVERISHLLQATEPLTPVEGSPAYVPLLVTKPFPMPLTLSRPSGLPVFPRISVGLSSARNEFMLTPDTLRNLGSTVGTFAARIHEIRLAYHAIESRAALQESEFQRQKEKCAEISRRVEELKGSGYARTEARLQKILANQKKLLAKLDRVLQSLMQEASPELSESETKWFEELQRTKAEVQGSGRYDEGSLVARTSLLKREYDRVVPSMKDMAVKERQRREYMSQHLGVSQAFELGEHSHAERTKIAALEKEVVQMASEADLSVGPPPSEKQTRTQ